MKGRQARRARAAGQQVEPTVFVGRGGVSDAHAAEVREQLRNRELVKVKLHRDATGADRLEVARALAEQSSAELVEVRGFTVLLARRRNRREP